MAVKPKRRSSCVTLLLLIAAIGIWVYDQAKPAAPKKSHPPAVEKSRPKTERYMVFQNCTLAEAGNNDGDSFLVRLPDGSKAQFRLYFVDTPESAFKSYRDGRDNHQRIRDQAAEMGDLEPEQVVEIGKKAKAFTLDLLGSQPFELHTRWDDPFRDERFHAFIAVQQNGKARWLEELLVERGFARIKTKAADLPDGTPALKQLARLRDLERAAKRAKAGAWGVK
jgi:endonuclease YncB( thermonuclease family)